MSNLQAANRFIAWVMFECWLAKEGHRPIGWISYCHLKEGTAP